MTVRTCLFLLCGALAAIPACVDEADPPVGDDGVDDPPPPMRHPDPTESCGRPGDGPCAAGTTCLDFGAWGGQACAYTCGSDDECESGCCIATSDGGGVCATEPWCGAGGIYPEALCLNADVCDVADDQAGCTRQVEACLDGLTDAQYQTWLREMDACWSATDCGAYFDCYAAVPYC